MKFLGKIEEGVIKIKDKEGWKMEKEKKEGKEIILEIKVRRKIRSLSQNNYRWFLLYYLEQQNVGYTKDEWNDLFKLRFIPKKIQVGEVVHIIPGTTVGMNTKQMTVFIKKIREYSNDTIGIYLPTPDEIPPEELEKFYLSR